MTSLVIPDVQLPPGFSGYGGHRSDTRVHGYRDVIDFKVRFGHVNQVDFTLRQLGQAVTSGAEQYGTTLGDENELAASGAVARVNAAVLPGRFGITGRWIADCGYCSGAEYVLLSSPRFMCCNCWNFAFGHKWRMVVLPSPQEIDEINRLLGNRPNPYTKVWEPGESLDDLRTQNIFFGAAT